jgi:Uma2 family endonuclease
MAGPVAEPMSIVAFRAWVATRPDEEHWELIAAVPTMMEPATRTRRRITSNLEWPLSDALEAHHPEFAAYQRVGINLAPVTPDYDPEPDVVVVDADLPGDERYCDRFYLVAEIVSSSDRRAVESKREIYKRHPSCRCVLVIEQDRFDVSVSLLSGSAWTERRLSSADDSLVLPDFGLSCTLADIYRGASLQPRKPR